MGIACSNFDGLAVCGVAALTGATVLAKKVPHFDIVSYHFTFLFFHIQSLRLPEKYAAVYWFSRA